MKPLLPLIVLSLCLTGCSLIPKKVELFQDKVRKFPEPPAALTEYQKEAALRAKQKAAETVTAAVSNGAPVEITAPAKETEKLTDIVATSLGPPRHEATDTDEIVAKLQSSIAKLDQKIEAFKHSNDENAGKKIEGTGLVQVPYFAWLGIVALGIVVLWHLGKLALTAASIASPASAPATMVGLGVMDAAQSTVTKGFSQLVAGGQDFLKWVDTKFKGLPLAQEIQDAFIASHKENQDKDVQTVVKQIK
jgi:hypothetical protein